MRLARVGMACAPARQEWLTHEFRRDDDEHFARVAAAAVLHRGRERSRRFAAGSRQQQRFARAHLRRRLGGRLRGVSEHVDDGQGEATAMTDDRRQRTPLGEGHPSAELFRHRSEGLLDGRRDVERLRWLGAQRGDVQHVPQEAEYPVDPAVYCVLIARDGGSRAAPLGVAIEVVERSPHRHERVSDLRNARLFPRRSYVAGDDHSGRHRDLAYEGA